MCSLSPCQGSEMEKTQLVGQKAYIIAIMKDPDYKHQEQSVFFSNVTLEIIQTHFIIFHAVLPLFKSTNFEYSAKSLKNETNKNITLETLNFKLTQLYLAERKHTLTISFNLFIQKKYILCFKLLLCSTLQSICSENLNMIDTHVGSLIFQLHLQSYHFQGVKDKLFALKRSIALSKGKFLQLDIS